MRSEEPIPVLPYANGRTSCGWRIELPGVLSGIAIAIVAVDLSDPDLISSPPPLWNAVFLDSFVWLACILSFASVVLTLWDRNLRWRATVWRSLVCACCVAMLVYIIKDNIEYVMRIERAAMMRP